MKSSHGRFEYSLGGEFVVSSDQEFIDFVAEANDDQLAPIQSAIIENAPLPLNQPAEPDDID